MNAQQINWLNETILSARAADHIYPDMAGCEAALESGFGTSALAREANNLFGLKKHGNPVHGILTMPTREYLNQEWVVVSAEWMKYDTLAECFTDRMDTLERLKNVYPEYAEALTAPDPQSYIAAVSKRWSTDPQRAAKVLAIYDQWQQLPVIDNSGDVAAGANGEN